MCVHTHSLLPGGNKNTAKTEIKGGGKIRLNDDPEDAGDSHGAHEAAKRTEGSREAAANMLDMMMPEPFKKDESEEESEDDESEDGKKKKKTKKGGKKPKKPQELCSIGFVLCSEGP